MATQTFNIVAFTLTMIIAVFLLILAAVVYLKGKKEYLNITLALLLISSSLFIVSGFAEKIFVSPSDSWTLFTFQWSYALGVFAFLFYFLFLLGLYLGHAPRKSFLVGLLITALPAALLSFSPWFIKNAHYFNGSLTSSPGPLYPIEPLLTLFFLTGCIIVAFATWRKSTGIDRARMNIIFMSLIVFIPFPAIFSYVLPVVTGNWVYADFTFFASLIPISFAAYAIIRLRLVDVRIILRRTGLFITFILLLAAPIALLFIALSNSGLVSPTNMGILFAIFVLFLAVAPFLWKWMEKYSSHLFFSGLYDSTQLKNLAEKRLSCSPDLTEAIPTVLRDLIAPLALETLAIVFTPGVLADHPVFYKASHEGGDISFSEGTTFDGLENISTIGESIITEELQRWPRDEEEAKLAKVLASKDISGYIPLKAGDRIQGYFLLGPKIGKSVLSITDISCLEAIGGYLALYIDNYDLAAQLKMRLRELEKVYEDLQMADEFKTEIINLTSHELRTPLTILNSFTQILTEKYSKSTEMERLQYLEYMQEASQRLITVIGQFLTVSNLQKGVAKIAKNEVLLDDLLLKVKQSFDDSISQRIKITMKPPGIQVLSDLFYLFMMLKNLVENALRFSDEKDPIVLESVASQNNVQISILDFGDGIPAEEAETIFQPFTRLEDFDKHHLGIGLGLYSVRLIADSLGTEIIVTTDPAQGTRFSFDLPIQG